MYSQYSVEYKSGKEYLRSLPGFIRALNVFCGFLELILVLIGFQNDISPTLFEDKYERGANGPWYKYTFDGYYETYDYYGIGYVSERPNVIQLICIVLSLVFSTLYLIPLVTSPLCQETSRGWNRFLNLTAGFLQAVGILNGILGLLLFRSYCCHVEWWSNERHMSEMEGYREPCLCYFSPPWKDNEYYTQLYQDVPQDVIFYSILPHHFIPHVFCLIIMTINMVAYIIATFRI